MFYGLRAWNFPPPPFRIHIHIHINFRFSATILLRSIMIEIGVVGEVGMAITSTQGQEPPRSIPD